MDNALFDDDVKKQLQLEGDMNQFT